MSKVHLRYDGWVALPAAALRKFGLSTGDRLEVEVTDDAIVLLPARRSGAPERASAEPASAEAPSPEPVAALAPIAKRGPGRPRKTPGAALPPALKTRGRRKATPALATQPQ